MNIAQQREKMGFWLFVEQTDQDEVVSVKLSDNTADLVMGTHFGKATRFPEDCVRTVGRVSQGVKGIKWKMVM